MLETRYSEKDQAFIDKARTTLDEYEKSLISKLKLTFQYSENPERFIKKVLLEDPMRQFLARNLCNTVAVCCPIYKVEINTKGNSDDTQRG